ncbi:hypothetical protein BH23ACT12_BH23ACT12_12180 [soil metagenome]
MAEVQLMHAGEEALLVLVPLAIVLYIDYRKRRREKLEAPAAGEEGANEHPAD